MAQWICRTWRETVPDGGVSELVPFGSEEEAKHFGEVFVNAELTSEVSHRTFKVFKVEGNMTTKEQEREALQKIREIVEGLGEDSYVGTAFEGVFEYAERNIELDFACSLKNELTTAQRQLDEANAVKAALEAENRALRRSVDELQRRILSSDDARMIETVLEERRQQMAREAAIAEDTIIELADDPTNPDFREAVLKHRYNVRNIKELARLVESIQGWMQEAEK